MVLFVIAGAVLSLLLAIGIGWLGLEAFIRNYTAVHSEPHHG